MSQRSGPSNGEPDPLSLLGNVHPVKSMGLDPLYGGDLRTLNPTLPRSHKGDLIGLNAGDLSLTDLDATWRRPLRDFTFTEISMYGLGAGVYLKFVGSVCLLVLQWCWILWLYFLVPSWLLSMLFGLSSCLLRGYLFGFGVTAFKVLGNLSLAALGVAFVPFAAPKKTDTPIYPSPSQMWAYAKWRLQQKWNWNWWYKASRGSWSEYTPMSGAVRKAIEKDQEMLSRKLFEYYTEDQRALAEAKKKVPTLSNYTLPFKWIPFKLKTDFENWFNNHTMKKHAEILRAQDSLNPGAPLTLGQRWTIFAKQFQGYGSVMGLARRKILRKYLRKNLNQFKFQGPWWFFFMFCYGMTIPAIYESMPLRIVERGTCLLAVLLLATHTNMWFFGRTTFRPQIRATPGQWVVGSLALYACAQLLNRAIEVVEGNAHQRTIMGDLAVRNRLEQFVDKIREGKSIPTLVESLEDSRRKTLEAKALSRTPHPDVVRYDSSEHVRKDRVFPGEGWEPWEVTVRDGGKLRTLNFTSMEFIRFGMFRPIYGTYLEWEALEKHHNERSPKSNESETSA